MTCLSGHALECECFKAAEDHGEDCAFALCRGIQRAQFKGERALALRLGRALIDSERVSGFSGACDLPMAKALSHNGGACCGCTCRPAARVIHSLPEYVEAVLESTGGRIA